MNNNLRFDAANHIYTLDGRIVPSVTQILKATGHIDTTWMTAEACERGIAVHDATEAVDLFDYEASEFDESINGYVEAHTRFICESGAIVHAVEQMVYSTLATTSGFVAYAGRYDRMVALDRYPRLIVDIKTGVAQPWHLLQGAAYCSAEGTGAWPACLYLRRNGRYILHIQTAVEFARSKAEWFWALHGYAKYVS